MVAANPLRGITGSASRSVLVLVLVAAVVLVGGAGLRLVRGDGYQLQLVFPSAPDVVKGLRVQVDGFDAGTVTDLAARDGHAVITVTLDKPYDEVTQGATAAIEWKAVLGERVIQITPGEEDAPALPDQAMVRGDDRVEVDQVLAALDEPTRRRLAATLIALDSAVAGRGDDLNATLAQLGPAVEALSVVLGGLGADGAAIRNVVTRSAELMDVLDENGASIRSVIRDLDLQQSDLAADAASLEASLRELPGTLGEARTTLVKVPDSVAAARPLLVELTAASDALPAFTDEVSPLLRDLNPTLRSSRRALTSLAALLGVTPALLTSSTQVLPDVDQATGRLLPALSFLRPYTPEFTGWFTNWASAGQQYLGDYHVARIKLQEGTTTPIGMFDEPPPGVTRNDRPLPGSNIGQPWTDATGARIR